MGRTIMWDEGEPETWPQVDPEDEEGPIPAEAETDEEPLRNHVRVAWQRVESWVAYRWSVRTAEFIVEGPGEWLPNVRPFAPSSIEQWIENAWVSTVVGPSPTGGYCLDGVGPYRFIGELGTDTPPPPVVKEAVWRLAKYLEAIEATPSDERGLTRHKVDLGNALSIEREHAANWMPRAMQLSGAADLLRPYRGLGTR